MCCGNALAGGEVPGAGAALVGGSAAGHASSAAARLDIGSGRCWSWRGAGDLACGALRGWQDRVDEQVGHGSG